MNYTHNTRVSQQKLRGSKKNILAGDPRRFEFALLIKKLQLYTSDEIASFLGVSRQALNYHIRKGRES